MSTLQTYPVQQLLLGEGLLSWVLVVQKMFFDYHLSNKGALQTMMNLRLVSQGIYYCTKSPDGVRLAVVQHPIITKKKEDARAWLEWLATLLEDWKDGKLIIIYGPSKKYDATVKLGLWKLSGLGINAVTKMNGSQYKVLINTNLCLCTCVYTMEERKHNTFHQKFYVSIFYFLNFIVFHLYLQIII